MQFAVRKIESINKWQTAPRAFGERYVKFFHLFLIFNFFLFSCAPVEKRRLIKKEEAIRMRGANLSTKIHLLDNSVILSPAGFTIAGDSLITQPGSQRVNFYRDITSPYWSWSVPLDSIVLLESYEKKVEGKRAAGSIILVTTTTIGVAVGVSVLFLYFILLPDSRR